MCCVWLQIVACVSIGVFALGSAITLLLLTTTGSGRTRSLPSSCTSLMRSSDEDIYCPSYTVQPMDASLIVLSVVEMVVSVWQSIVCLARLVVRCYNTIVECLHVSCISRSQGHVCTQASSGATTQRSNPSRDSDTGPYIVSASEFSSQHPN